MLDPLLDPKVVEAFPLLLPTIRDEAARQEVEAILRAPGVRLIASDRGDYLFVLPATVREEHQHYRVFVFGWLLEIRGTPGFSNEFSMVDFPEDLAPCRSRIESRFVELFTSTEGATGWFAPARWEDLTQEELAIAKPKFIRDDVRSSPM
jgi:hypothetical protein